MLRESWGRVPSGRSHPSPKLEQQRKAGHREGGSLQQKPRRAHRAGSWQCGGRNPKSVTVDAGKVWGRARQQCSDTRTGELAPKQLQLKGCCLPKARRYHSPSAYYWKGIAHLLEQLCRPCVGLTQSQGKLM